MNSDAVKLNGFNFLINKLKEKNIDVNEQDLSSIISLQLENNKTINTKDLANSLIKQYSLSSNTEILDILNTISQNDGIENELNINDFTQEMKLDENNSSAIDTTNYNSNEWESIKPTKNKGFLGIFGSDTYTYKTPDGSTIKVKNTDNIEVKVNSKTNEIVVIGASQADINMNENSNLTIVESTVNKINAKNGNETINIKGAHTTISKIKGGKGSQNINITDGAKVENIKTGKGDDTINVDSASLGNIQTGKGNDTVNINNTNIQSKLKTGSGNDNINISNTNLTGKVQSGLGDDNININSSEIDGKVQSGTFGNSTINVENSTLSNNSKINTGFNNNIININNSNINGKISASLIHDNLEINAQNSKIQKVKGISFSNTEINSTDSAIKNINIQNYNRNITSLDTTQGKYQGYNLIQPVENEEDILNLISNNSELNSQTIDNKKIYSLSDGTIILINNNGGEIYQNEEGKIILNGIDNANIISKNFNEITAINSTIANHSNINGIVNYQNCIVDNINISENSSNTQINSDNSNLKTIDINNSSAEINVKNNSNISKIEGISLNNNEINLSLDNSNIEKIKLKNELGINLITTENNQNSSIEKINIQQGSITGNVSNIEINSIKTNSSIDLTAKNSTIENINNSNAQGFTNINFNNVTLNKITSKSASNIELDNCTVNKEIKTSDFNDNIKINNSEVNKIKTKQGEDNLEISESEINKINSQGITSIYASDINKLNTLGDVAISKSQINKLNSNEINQLTIENSIINNEIYEDIFGDIENNDAYLKINEIENQETEELYTLLEEFAPNEINEILSQNENLSKQEIISKVLENPSENLIKIKEQIILQMQGEIKNLEDSIKNEESSLGKFGVIKYIFDNNRQELKNKKEILENVIESNDLSKILTAYTLITNEIGNSELIQNTSSSLEYSKTLNNDKIKQIINTLEYIGNDLEYQMTSQDGLIKEIIAQYNNVYDIGTNRKEVEANLKTYRENVNQLKEKFEQGKLTNNEFISEYKQITGNDLTENNVNSLLDTIRGNDKFDNIVEEKIEDYQKTQSQIFQVGEYAITIVAGAAVTFVSGGVAGPAIASALTALGKMGIALTATTVSLITKTAIEATERHTNSIVADNMTPEEFATSAALMYAGCLCGQFGNAVGDYIRANGVEFFSKFISSKEMVDIATKVAGKTLEIGADTGASVLTTAMITGSGSFNEEFMQNLRSEMIGLIQSKITNAYFKSHPEIQINTQLYSARKALDGVAESTANVQILKSFGFSDSDAVKYSSLSAKEVDTLALTQKLIDTGKTDLAKYHINTENSNVDEVINKAQKINDLFNNIDKIKQSDNTSCAVVSVLNAIKEKPELIEAVMNKLELVEVKENSNIYKFSGFDNEIEIKSGENLLQKIYECYQEKYNTQSGNFVVKVFNEILTDASDIIVKPDSNNIAQLKIYNEDNASILTFNTTDEINGISQGHSYTVLDIDDFGNLKLQDPINLKEITVYKSDYENKDCQIQGKTYFDEGMIDNGMELKLVAGAEIENKSQEIEQDTFIQEQLNRIKNYYGEDSAKKAKQLLSNEKLVELMKDDKIDTYNIRKWAELSESNFKNLQTLLSNEKLVELIKGKKISSYDIRKWAELSEDSFKNLQTLLSNEKLVELMKDDKIDTYNIQKWAELSEDSFKNLQTLLSDEKLVELIKDDKIHTYDIKGWIELNEDTIKNLQTLLSDEKLVELIKDGKIETSNIRKWAKLSEDSFKNLQTLLSIDNVSQSLSRKNSSLLFGLETISEMPQDEFKNAVKILSNTEFIKLVNSKNDDFEANLFFAKIYDLSKLNESTVDNLVNNLNRLSDICDDKYEININKLQMSDEIILTATKTFESSDNPEGLTEHITPEEYSEYVMVTKIITVNPDGTLLKSTTYRDNAGNEESWLSDSDRTLIINKKTGDAYTNEYITKMYGNLTTANLPVRDINYQIEIVNNKQGEPSYILYTKESPELAGAYETTKYNLKDYPEDMDVLSAIKNGTIEGGIKLSTVENKDGTIKYQENYERNNCNINRNYIQQIDEEGKLNAYEYSYNIKDDNNNNLLTLNRSWIKNQDGTTTTVVNGKTYIASFNDETLEVKLTLDDGTQRTINLKDKLAAFEEYNADSLADKEYVVNQYKTEETTQKAFFEFAKTLPADQLITIDNHVNKIFMTEAISSAMGRGDERRLYIGPNAAILSHEMGHGIDFEGTDILSEEEGFIATGKISSNPELIKLYNQEMEKFTKEYPQEAQNIIDYFTQMGGGDFFGINTNAGISELVAETNMLMTTYGQSEEVVQTRSEYLVRYFPKTIAKAGELLGMNDSNDTTLKSDEVEKNKIIDYKKNNEATCAPAEKSDTAIELKPTKAEIEAQNKTQMEAIKLKAPSVSAEIAKLSTSDILSELEQIKDTNPRAKDILDAWEKLEIKERTPIIEKRLKDAYDILNQGENYVKLMNISEVLAKQYSEGTKTKDALQDFCDTLGIKLNTDITKNNNNIYLTQSDLYSLSARAKGTDSTYSKNRNKIYDLKIDMPETVKQAAKTIGDAQGLRLVFNRGITTTDNEFIDKFANAIKKGEILITEVNNYSGKDGKPYLSNKDIDKIQKAYNEWFDNEHEKTKKGIGQYEYYKKPGYKKVNGETVPTIIEILRDKTTGIEFEKGLKIKSGEDAKRNNGYTASQFNLITENGELCELQVRGEAINEIAEYEHIVYDVFKKKDTSLKPEYDEIRQVADKINSSDDLKAKYDKYFYDVYEACRKYELNEGEYAEIKNVEELKKTFPDIKDYGLEGFTPEELELVSIQGIEKLYHELHSKNKDTQNGNK